MGPIVTPSYFLHLYHQINLRYTVCFKDCNSLKSFETKKTSLINRKITGCVDNESSQEVAEAQGLAVELFSVIELNG